EAAITLGTTGVDSVYFEEGIRASMSKVSIFSATTDPNAPLMDPDDIDAYVAARIAELNAAGLNDFQKLNIVVKEKYYAGFGNGIEVFTDYRRTGAPADLPTSLAPAAPFPLRLYYSVNETATNPNAVQLPIDTPIFWDK
ncbi:MAG: SusD/RagB family nutrient-binding outer membrane lipoprotein, partial [Cyclobacteriaceae bacterium]|nr:SusD/RagB family nutrient-binding outer membrane lipoprotein [Cyclobacteriaceae bacterium]